MGSTFTSPMYRNDLSYERYYILGAFFIGGLWGVSISEEGDLKAIIIGQGIANSLLFIWVVKMTTFSCFRVTSLAPYMTPHTAKEGSVAHAALDSDGESDACRTEFTMSIWIFHLPLNPKAQKAFCLLVLYATPS